MSHDPSHSHDHDHGHPHHHHHSHGEGGEMSMEEKLNTLFSHWIGHNDSHKDNFFSWAQKAREAGLDSVALDLEEAGTLSDKVTAKLKEAHQRLKS